MKIKLLNTVLPSWRSKRRPRPRINKWFILNKRIYGKLLKWKLPLECSIYSGNGKLFQKMSKVSYFINIGSRKKSGTKGQKPTSSEPGRTIGLSDVMHEQALYNARYIKARTTDNNSHIDDDDTGFIIFENCVSHDCMRKEFIRTSFKTQKCQKVLLLSSYQRTNNNFVIKFHKY